MPNKLSQFWQELKRRNVVRVITIYAGAAFVIIELINNITEPLRLPEWTPTLVIVLLAIGFPVVIIFSWIYDVRPEGGMVKTESVDKLKAEDVPKSSNRWRIASFISFVVIIALIVLNIIPRNEKNVPGVLDKSIAVLPFRNESADESNTYFINGTMEAILDNLCRIKDLRVPARTSVEQYRDAARPVSEIAGELKVSYILEGSMQKIGNRILLTVQLIEGSSDQHLWSRQYDRVINEVEDQIDLQSEIAQLVAAEIKATITPMEKELIENIPTTNTTAYEFYQKGMDEYGKYAIFFNNTESLRSAENLFRYALEYDSTLAPAYSGLAWVYFYLEDYEESYFSEDYLDTVLILANKAISINPNLSDAYAVKGNYFRDRGMVEQAISSYNKALELNPNDWNAYWGLGMLYNSDDLVKAIDNLTQALSRNNGPMFMRLVYQLCSQYYAAGFMDKGDSIIWVAAKMTGDSVFSAQSLREWMVGNSKGQLAYAKKAYDIYPNATTIFEMGKSYAETGQFEEAIQYWDRYLEMLEASGSIEINEMHHIGYAYWMNGDMEKGTYYMNMQKEYFENSIRLGRRQTLKLVSYYHLAGIYAFLGDRDKAYENLRIFNQRDKMPQGMANLIKRDPLFDSIRDEPEFQQIASDIEAKYRAEHERVRQWLEENKML